MKKLITIVTVALLFASCSSNRYVGAYKNHGCSIVRSLGNPYSRMK